MVKLRTRIPVQVGKLYHAAKYLTLNTLIYRSPWQSPGSFPNVGVIPPEREQARPDSPAVRARARSKERIATLVFISTGK